METILNVLRKTEAFLASKGLDQPRLEAEWLLSHGLGLQRMDLYLQFERPLVEAELTRLRDLVRERGRRVPLQHLIGEQDFHGCRIRTDRRALIPRPETEELVDAVIARSSVAPRKVLDLGTGSGCVALALGQAFPSARIIAIDRSKAALELAEENMALNPEVSKGIQLRIGNWFEGQDHDFDLIVSNPPYLTEREWTDSQPEVREHDPREALIGGEDGWTEVLHLVECGYQHLIGGGMLAMETGPDQHDRLLDVARALPYSEVESRQDMSGRPRFLFLKVPAVGDVA